MDGLCDSIVACAPVTQNTLDTLATINTLTLNTIDNTIVP